MRSTSLPTETFSNPQLKSKLPATAPEVIARHTITTDNPDDILTYVNTRGERQLQALVQRYIHQLLYGCQNSFCTTPTCFSYQRRNAKTPLRKLTPLSARALACSLASEKDPEAALCRNAPARKPQSTPCIPNITPTRKTRIRNVSPPAEKGGDLETGARQRRSKSDEATRSRGLSVTWKETSNPVRRSSRSAEEAPKGDERASIESTSGYVPAKSEEFSKSQQDAPRKDFRSFTQVLFDTLALKMLGWAPSSQSSDTPSSHTSSHSLEAGEDILPSTSGFPQSTTEKVNRRATLKPNEPRDQYNSCGQRRRTESNSPSENQDRWENSRSLTKDDNSDGSPQDERLAMFHDQALSRSSERSSIESQMHHQQCSHSGTIGEKSRECFADKSFAKSSYANGNAVEPFEQGLNSIPKAKSPRSDLRNKELRAKPLTSKARPRLVHTKSDSEVQTLSKFDHEILAGLCTLVDKVRSPTGSSHKNESNEILEEIGSQKLELTSFIEQSVFYVLKDPARIRRSFLLDGPTSINSESYNGSSVWPASETNEISELLQSSRQMHHICSKERIWNSLWIALGHLFTPPPSLARTLRHGKKSGGQPKSDGNIAPESQSLCGHSSTRRKFVPDGEAARVCVITLLALAIKAFEFNNHPGIAWVWSSLWTSREFGWRSLPNDAEAKPSEKDTYYDLMDTLDNSCGVRLIGRLATAISNRVAFNAIEKSWSKDPLMAGLRGAFRNSGVLRKIWADIGRLPPTGFAPKRDIAHAILVWTTTLITDEWDGRVQIQRSSEIGGSLQLLASMYEARAGLDLEVASFQIQLLSDRLDPIEIPAEWLEFIPDNKTFHLLSFPFLFLPSALVQYFRAINHASMWKAFENATTQSHLARQLLREDTVPIHNETDLLMRLRPSMACFLVLNVRRDNVLSDAINLLWRREKRELLRPLKVKMGMELGEEGVDAGGVQQEFFRILFGEALNPDFGMFATDEQTRMAWYQPASQEPLYKFEMLGLLMSLAVYNSVTLSVTFPLAFYRKLLGLKVKKIEHIEDGWPDLAKGLGELLHWSDGDVADVFVRTYEFSYEAFGTHVNVDMEKVGREAPWPRGKRSKGKEKAKSASFDFSSEIRSALKEEPSATAGNRRASVPPLTPPEMEGEPSSSSKRSDPVQPLIQPSILSTPATPLSSIDPGITTPGYDHDLDHDTNEASLVTNANRAQYIKDYIFWLTDKSVRAQHEAFLRGFLVCLSPRAISIFTPEALKSLVEGFSTIDIDGLERIAKYADGYSADHKVMRWFWEVVREMDAEDQRRLLEFVTASDRLPVTGVEALVFVVQRAGDEDGRLPTSHTCFGRLLLPEYSEKEVLRKQLICAVTETRGFYMA